MKRDWEAIDTSAASVAKQENLDLGNAISELSPEETVLVVLQAAENYLGRKPSRDETRQPLLDMADYHDRMAAAFRRYANGPDLRIVKDE